jgi:hypothetical protein
LFGADGSCRDADRLVRHGDDWAAFRLTVSRYGRISPGIGSWRGSDRTFPFRNHWPDEPITAMGHGLDPTLAARRLRQNPAQCRDLHGEVAFLDNLAGPGSLDQGVFRNHRAWPFEQGL